ncbi:hypothetical protein [Caballeronia calidae]|uniref:hypothetical protein n=1 Tax=Caballeronia calidae TaxID=1777139 RepID=UPI0012FE6587|nr:hypothetical protein [Caballeronia calidae]
MSADELRSYSAYFGTKKTTLARDRIAGAMHAANRQAPYGPARRYETASGFWPALQHYACFSSGSVDAEWKNVCVADIASRSFLHSQFFEGFDRGPCITASAGIYKHLTILFHANIVENKGFF